MKRLLRLRFLGILALLHVAATAAPVRVSFLDSESAREDTLRAFAEAGGRPEDLDALRQAIVRYYRAPLALDVSMFPPAENGFHAFASVADFVSALGTHQLSYLPRDFGMNCLDAALLLAAPDMDVAADRQSPDGPFYAVQVTGFQEKMVPVDTLGAILDMLHPVRQRPPAAETQSSVFSEKHRLLEAVFYQYQFLPLDATAGTVAAEMQKSLQRHWARCGIRFPARLSLVLLHRASLDSSLAVTDHAGLLLRRDNGYLYFEKTGGRGPFLRIDLEDPADLAAYYSTMTWPDCPHNLFSIDDARFLEVPRRNQTAPPAATEISPAISPVAPDPVP